jgi:NTP pyrophosphatase (non-canonical NTP hydrolase)
MITHNQLVTALVKSPEQIKAEITADELNIVHMILGVSGEAGELLDTIKKSVIYRKPLDLNNIVEELGDIEFYLEGLRQALGIDRAKTLDANIAKLSIRYSKLTYENDAAIKRADKEL